jgi:hypothetical protein
MAYPASAATITDAFTFSTVFSQGHQVFDVDEDLPLDLFDPTLGTLQGVTVLFTTALTNQTLLRTVACEEDNPRCQVAAAAHITSTDRFVLQLGAGVLDWVSIAGPLNTSPEVECEGIGACVAVAALPPVLETYTRSFDAPADLNLFQGGGTFPVNYDLQGTTCGGFSQNGDSTCHYTGQLTVTGRITYTYDPAAVVEPIPEPATVLLLASGVGTMVARRRRRK